MSKGMAIIGIALGAIVAGVLTFGAALPLIAAAGGAFLGMGAVGWGVTIGALTLAGGVLSTVSSWSGSGGSSISNGSPTYSWGKLQTQTSNCLAIPIIYGEVKVAGNTIWQAGAGTATLQKVIALGDGEIEAITDVRINNKGIGSLPGCNYSSYTGTKTQLIDGRIAGGTNAGRAKLVGGLKNTAYIALTAKASNELSGGVNLTTIVKGSKVKVYSDLYNYEMKYSNNPSWCILDFLTRYNGCGIPLNELDLQSFIDAAAYCNELVGEEGKQQPRFALNIVLDEKKSRIDWLENMLITCRGYSYYQGGKLALKIEKEETAMQLFDQDNILAGSEKFWTTPREKKTDIFKVQYIDPKNEYARIFAHAEAEEFENEQPIVQEVQAWGVTNFNQASRLAWFYLNQAKTCNKFISFSTSQEGLDRTVGDVINVTSTFLGYENKKMRIVHLAEAQEGQIEIVCKEYNENLYSDKTGSAEPVINTINLPNVFDTPPTPENLVADENCWRTPEGNYVATIKVSYDELDYFHLSHYEISYSMDNGETWEQGKISYNNSYTIENVIIGQEYLVKVQSVTRKNIFSEPAKANVLTIGKNNPPEAVKDFVVIQKGDYLKAIITPPNDPDIDYYEIRQGLFWEDSELVQVCIETSTLFKPTQNGTVSYLVKAVDNVGNYANIAVRAVLDVSGVTPKNIIIEQTFKEADFILDEDYIILPEMDMGVNFQDYRTLKETGLFVVCNQPVKIWYRSGYSKFMGWDYLEYDADNWEDTPETDWSDWKSLCNEPNFYGQYVQVKVQRIFEDEQNENETIQPITEVTVIADIEDTEDTVSNIEIPQQKTTIELNKNFTIPPTIIPTTTDKTGKVCSWRVSNVKSHYFDIELLDKNDNLIAGKILTAVARGY